MSGPGVSSDKRDAYAEGREAHDAGQSDAVNPYDFTDDWEAWLDGWNAAVEAATDDAMEPRP